MQEAINTAKKIRDTFQKRFIVCGVIIVYNTYIHKLPMQAFTMAGIEFVALIPQF